MSDRMRVVIVDDHPLFREGVALALAANADIEIVGQGGTADEALHLARKLAPDVVVLDIDMPGGGLSAARAIAEACPGVKIVMLTGSEDDEDVLAALKVGARAYVLKGISSREMVAILRRAYVGESYVPPTLAAGLLMHMAGVSTKPQPAAANPLSELTRGEQEILELVAAGCSNREIGQKVYLSEKTVKHHMTNILQKLHVRSRLEAALLARKLRQPGRKG